MRVLLLHSRYLSGSASGENRVVEDDARLLREAGHHVDVWQPSVSPGSSRVRMAADAVWSRSAAHTVGRLVREHEPDIVHVHSVYPRVSPAVLREIPSGLPLLMTLHNFRLMCLPATYVRDGRICEDCAGKIPWRGVLHRCYRESRTASAALATSYVVHRALDTYSRIDRFLAVSRFVRDKHVDVGVAPDRIRVKSNFAWPAPRRRDPGRHLLFAGRIAPEKGLDVVLRSLPEGAELVVAGDGPDRARLEQRYKSGAVFLGQVDAPAVEELLRDARALLVPSLWYEGQPRIIVEALAAGVPVLASRIGGLPEIVEDGTNGWLVDVGAEHQWRDVLAGIHDDDRAQALGAGAYASWLARFTPEIALGEIEDVYRDVIALKRGRR
jgi:glycosyltransferase involved in cell wall biosynthesis